MRLPVELTDKIIDEAISVLPAWQEHREIVLKKESSLALVSRAFRQCTNFHRFTHVSFLEDASIEFLKILQSSIWTGHTGIARHIRKIDFAFHIFDGDEGTASYYEPLGLEAYIFQEALNIIFRRRTSNQIKPTLALLAYHVDDFPYRPTIYRKQANWRKMDPKIVNTLESLIKGNHRLSCLELEGFFNVPLTLFASSRMLHTVLKNVTLKAPKESVEFGHLSRLEILELQPRKINHLTKITKHGQFESLRKLVIHTDVNYFDPDASPQCGETDVLRTLNAIFPKIPSTCNVEISLHNIHENFSPEWHGFCEALGIHTDSDEIDHLLHTRLNSLDGAITIRLNVLAEVKDYYDEALDLENITCESQEHIQTYFPLVHKTARRKMVSFHTSQGWMMNHGPNTGEKAYKVEFCITYLK